ncbi:MAG: hypothetical protein DIU74_008970 [Pseudomonadota bacterium]
MQRCLMLAVFLAPALAALAACNARTSSEPPPVEDTAFGELSSALDRAHAVEDANLQRKQDLDRALEVAH